MKESEWRYSSFRYEEFDSPDLPRSGLKMSKEYMDKLQEARNETRKLARKYIGRDIPYVIVSGGRTPAHNKKVGGVHDSEHIIDVNNGNDGHGADIRARSGHERYFILMGLIKAGFNRIGINRTTIHAGDDKDKTQMVIWDYYK